METTPPGQDPEITHMRLLREASSDPKYFLLALNPKFQPKRPQLPATAEPITCPGCQYALVYYFFDQMDTPSLGAIPHSIIRELNLGTLMKRY